MIFLWQHDLISDRSLFVAGFFSSKRYRNAKVRMLIVSKLFHSDEEGDTNSRFVVVASSCNVHDMCFQALLRQTNAQIKEESPVPVE
jgi:hypothetical protein